jgi:hypothetical protein
MTKTALSNYLLSPVLVLAISVITLATVGSTPASASQASATNSKAATRGGPALSNYLTEVSCTSATFCMAAGNSLTNLTQATVAETWNGSTWTLVESPNVASGNFQGVSCTSPTSCTAVGGSKLGTVAETWDGSTWTVDTTPNPYSGSFYYKVSCVPGTSFCMAVGSDSRYATAISASSDGGTWTEQTVPEPDPSEFNTLQGISCLSETFCMADGETGGNNSLAEMWNGTSWTVDSTPNPNPGDSGDPNEMTDISCSSTSWCMGTLFGPYTLSWNGTTWTSQSVASPAGAATVQTNDVSCTSETSCSATGYYTNSSGSQFALAETWNGTAWSVQTIPDPAKGAGEYLTGLSCTGSGSCMTVGNFEKRSIAQGLTESETSGSWAVVSTPPVVPLSLSVGWGPPRSAVTVSGFGFSNGAQVKVSFEPGNIEICETTATTNGEFSCNARIPGTQKAPLGKDDIVSSGKNGLKWEATFTVT